LKEGIQRPGEEKQIPERSKATRGGRTTEGPRTTPAIEGLCGKFEARPKVKGKGKAKAVEAKPKRGKKSGKGKGIAVKDEALDEGYGTDEVSLTFSLVEDYVIDVSQKSQGLGTNDLKRVSSGQETAFSKSDETPPDSSMQLDRFSGASKFDPFAATAVPMNRRAEEMIFHCTSSPSPLHSLDISDSILKHCIPIFRYCISAPLSRTLP